MRTGYIAKIADLGEYFEKVGIPKWNLYHGFQKGTLQNGALVYKQDNAEMELGESWDLLNQIIEMNCGGGSGAFTIYFPTVASNVGTRVYYQHGTGPVGVAASVAGVPNQLHPAQLGYVSADELDRRLKEEKYKWELEKRLDDLEASNGPSGFGEILMNNIANNEGTMQALLQGLLGFLNIAAAKVAGMPLGNPGPAIIQGPPATDVHTDFETGEVSEADVQRCNAALERIAQTFPDLAGFLEGLANYIQKDPTTAKTLFSQFVK